MVSFSSAVRSLGSLPYSQSDRSGARASAPPAAKAPLRALLPPAAATAAPRAAWANRWAALPSVPFSLKWLPMICARVGLALAARMPPRLSVGALSPALTLLTSRLSLSRLSISF